MIVNVKAQGLLNAAKWLEDEYGRDALGAIVRACSPPVRERYTSAIAINWHPVAELVEFMGEADRQLGRGTGKLAEQIGAAGARANMRGTMLRLVFYVSKPEFLMKRVASFWRQFNDEGTMELVAIDRHSMQLEVIGVREPHALFCASITGWCREVVRASGAASPVSKHTSCIARGQGRCLWDVRYGLDGDEAAPPSSSGSHENASGVPSVSCPSVSSALASSASSSCPSRPPASTSRIARVPSRPPGGPPSGSHTPVSRPPGSARGDD